VRYCPALEHLVAKWSRENFGHAISFPTAGRDGSVGSAGSAGSGGTDGGPDGGNALVERGA
jgi:hypothetical protein